VVFDGLERVMKLAWQMETPAARAKRAQAGRLPI